MNVTETSKKKSIRPKNEIREISAPFDFKHSLHVGHEEKLEDYRPISPAGHSGKDNRPFSSPGPSSKDNKLEHISEPDESVLNLLKEEILPALRQEIGDIVESKLKSLLFQDLKKLTPHCNTCSCFEKEGNKREIRRDQFEGPILYSAIPAEDVTLKTKYSVRDQDEGWYVNKTVRSSLYHSIGQTVLAQTLRGNQLIKYGSDLQLARDEISEEGSSAFSRSKTLPGFTTKIQDSALELTKMKDNYRGRTVSKNDERECMAHALQWHVEDLVDGILFKESELPDSLLADGCLTEEECSSVRQKLDRRDQIRVLLRIIKGRDLNILKRFLRHIRVHNPDIAQKIEKKFDQNLKSGMRCSKCALCKLTTKVNLKYIADVLWRNELVDEGLFNMIVDTDMPTGAQGELWHQVLCSFKEHKSSVVRNVLEDALTKKNHYHHIAQGVKQMMSANKELKCLCKIKNTLKYGSFTSLVSSRSPQSSESELRTDSYSEITFQIHSPPTELTQELTKELYGRNQPQETTDQLQTLDIISCDQELTKELCDRNQTKETTDQVQKLGIISSDQNDTLKQKTVNITGSSVNVFEKLNLLYLDDSELKVTNV